MRILTFLDVGIIYKNTGQGRVNLGTDCQLTTSARKLGVIEEF